jgi:hypothetical protein
MTRNTTGTITASRAVARSRFSNCPPHSATNRRGLDLLRDGSLRVGDEAAQVAAPDIGLDHDAALAVLAADLVGSFGGVEAGQGWTAGWRSTRRPSRPRA